MLSGATGKCDFFYFKTSVRELVRVKKMCENAMCKTVHIYIPMILNLLLFKYSNCLIMQTRAVKIEIKTLSLSHLNPLSNALLICSFDCASKTLTFLY